MASSYYIDPKTALEAKLKQYEAENVTLRNQLMDAVDDNFNLQATMATIEAEAKYNASQEVIGLQSELKFKKNEVEQQRLEVSKLMKEVQELRQKQQDAARIATTTAAAATTDQIKAGKINAPESESPYDSSTSKREENQGSQKPISIDFLSVLQRGLDELLLACSVLSSQKDSGISGSISPSRDIVHSPWAGSFTPTNRGATHRNSRAPPYTIYPSANLIPVTGSSISPLQELMYEMEQLSAFCLKYNTQVHQLQYDNAVNNNSIHLGYDCKRLLSLMLTVCSTMVHLVLPFTSSSAMATTSNSASVPSHHYNSETTGTVLSVHALIRTFDLVAIILEYTPWSVTSVTDIVVHEKDMATLGVHKTKGRNGASASDNNGRGGGGDDDDDDDADLLTTSARVRSNLSQRFDRLKPTSRTAINSISSNKNGNGVCIENIVRLSTSSNSSNPIYQQKIADSYVHVLTQALQRVKVSSSASNTTTTTSNKSSNNNTSGNSPLVPCIEILASSNSSTSLLQPLALTEAGSWTEQLLDIIHDATCRHIVLIESDFDYRHNATQASLTQSLIECLTQVGYFLRRHQYNHASRGNNNSDTTGRYLTTMFDKMSISRVKYHHAYYHNNSNNRDHHYKKDNILINNTVGITGGTHSIAPKLFTALSSSSMIGLLLQYSSIVTTKINTSGKDSRQFQFLHMIQRSLQYECCFAAFLRQQCTMMRHVHRLLSSSDNNHHLNNAGKVMTPIVLYLVQELCNADGLFASMESAVNSSTQKNSSYNYNNSNSSYLLESSFLEQNSLVDEASPPDAHPSNTNNMSNNTIENAPITQYTVNPPVLQKDVLESKLQTIRWLLMLAQTWSDCFVALLLQIVPPQFHSWTTNTHHNSSSSSGNIKRDDQRMNVDSNDEDDDYISDNNNKGTHSKHNQDFDGLAQSMMTGVVALAPTTSTNSSNMNHNKSKNGHLSSSVTTLHSSVSTSSSSAASSSDVKVAKKRRGANNRLRMLDDILEESSDDDDGNSHKLTISATNNGSKPTNMAGNSSTTVMDVDSDGDGTSNQNTNNSRKRHLDSTNNSKTTATEEIDWRAFKLSSLHFEASSSSSNTSNSSHTIAMYTSAGIVQISNQATANNRNIQTYNNSNNRNNNFAHRKTRMQALSGGVFLAPYNPASNRRNNNNNNNGNSYNSVFDMAYFVGICKLWVQLWQWCDTLPRQNSTKSTSISSAETLLLMLTRECTRLLNAIVGVLVQHRQCRVLIRDVSVTLTTFFYRDILKSMHPDLRLAPSDYDQLDALEG